LEYGLSLAPTAADVGTDAQQVLTYNKHSSIASLKQAVEDIDKAIGNVLRISLPEAQRKGGPDDRERLTKEVSFITKLVDKALGEAALSAVSATSQTQTSGRQQ